MTEVGTTRPRAVWLRLLLLCLIIAAGGVLALTVGLPSPDRIRELISGWGVAGIAVFILGYAAATLMPVPASALTVLAGLLFGVVGGIGLVLVAATLGAYCGFWLGRLLGRDAVERLTGQGVHRVDQLLRRRGLLAVLGIRLIPVVPFVVVNYASGLTSVRQHDYVLGTVLGIMPATVAYVVVGAYGTSPLSWPFALAVGALVLLAAGSAVVLRHARFRDGLVAADTNKQS